MTVQNLSIRWKIALPIIAAITIGITFSIIVTGVRTRQIVLEEMAQSALGGHRDGVLNSLTTLMTTGTYAASKEHYLSQMKQIADIRVLQSALVARDFPDSSRTAGLSADALEQEVLAQGKEKVVVEGDYIRGVYPYIARSSYMGENCLSCHKVKDGEVLGAVSIRLPLARSLARIRTAQYVYAALGLGGIVGVLVLVLGIVSLVLRPFMRFTAEFKEMSGRYSGLDLNQTEGDEIVRVHASVTELIRHFSAMINNVMISSSKFLPIIDLLKDVVEKTAHGAGRQSGQAAQIATAAEEMSQTINDIARNASTAAETSAGALEIAIAGKQVTDTAVLGVREVHQSALELSRMMEDLNAHVGEIGNIVTVIKDIADQTNLLALNAAIEAARAGEQGRGFSVVADEVRKLAERTIKATNEVSAKIQVVQQGSTLTASSMGEATEKSTKTARHIGSVGESLNTILSEMDKVKDEITKIATAVEEQSATTGEVAKNIEDTSSIAHDIEEMSGRALREVVRLTEVAEELRGITGGVRTKGSAVVMLELAKSDHRNFVGRIGSCIRGETTIDPAALPDHHTCRFGKWYDTGGTQLCGSMPSFKSIDQPHEKIHQIARQAVEAIRSGNKERAGQLFTEVELLSGRITEAIDRAKTECIETQG